MEINKKIANSEVEAALDRIVRSSSFINSPRMCKFLTYVVEKKLAGTEGDLKAYSIAVDALGSPESFDAQSDPVVRVLAGRVRAALTEYYEGEGTQDEINISVPTGGYRPMFERVAVERPDEPANTAVRTGTPLSRAPRRRAHPIVYVLVGIIAVLVPAVLYLLMMDRSSNRGVTNSIQSVSPSRKVVVLVRNTSSRLVDENTEFFEELKATLSRNSTFSIISPGAPDNISPGAESQSSPNPNFIIASNIKEQGDGRRIFVELLHGGTNEVIWARSRSFKASEGGIQSYAKIGPELAREVSGKILSEYSVQLSTREPTTLTVEQLFLLATWVPGPAQSTLEWERERVDLARMALEKNPDFGQAHSVLADKLAYLSATDPHSHQSGTLDQARVHAQRAMELGSNDANVMFNIAQSYWHAGRVKEAVLAYSRVLDLDPSNGLAGFFKIVASYSCSIAPDDVIEAARAFDKSLDADNPIRWVTQTWLGWLHLNRAEYEKALDAEEHAAQIFKIPYTVMRHAAILNHLGRVDAAANLLGQYKKNWPTLSSKHFAEVTMPRLCAESEDPQVMLKYYAALRDNMASRGL